GAAELSVETLGSASPPHRQPDPARQLPQFVARQHPEVCRERRLLWGGWKEERGQGALVEVGERLQLPHGGAVVAAFPLFDLAKPACDFCDFEPRCLPGPAEEVR